MKVHAEARSAWYFLAPSLILYGIYVIFPIFHTFYISLTDWDGISSIPYPLCFLDEGRSCFENYAELLDDRIFWLSLKNNLFWLIGFGISPLIGLGLAMFFHRQGFVARLYKSLFYLPMVFSLVVVAMVWGWFLQPEVGLVEYVLKAVGLMAENEQVTILASFDWAILGLIIAASWPHTAYCMVLYLAGLTGIQESQIEAAKIDGVNSWQMFRHVIWPGLRPSHVIVIVVTMIGALRSFEIVAVMTDGGPANASNVLANFMYQESFRNFRYGYGAAIAVVLFAISLGLIMFYIYQANQSEEQV